VRHVQQRIAKGKSVTDREKPNVMVYK